MIQKTRSIVLIVVALLAFAWSVRSVCAGGGIVLRPPFSGVYRVTSYFDHHYPDYGTDNGVTIYTGESVADCSPYCYQGHDGWDWSMITGTDVLAAAAGRVVVSQDNRGCYGHTIIIDHGNGYYTMYSHLSQRLVEVNTSVIAGQHIAESGDSVGTGCDPVNAHLHFGVRHGGYDTTAYAIDPFGWRGSGRDPLYDFNQKESSCLWSGGPGSVISCGDVIVEDDGAAGWEQYPTSDKNCGESGRWQRCDKGNGFCYHWTDVWDPADFWVTWRPWYSSYGQLRYPGYYQIHAFVPAATDSTKTKTGNARYEVHHGYDDKETTVVAVNQTTYSDQWAPLGVYWLWPGQMGGYVSMYDYTGEASGSRKIVADSVRFSASVVHLPYVRNSGGWTSAIVIRNNATAQASAAVNYYRPSEKDLDFLV